MRKILLAGVATFAMAGVASAGEMQFGQGGILGTAAPGKSIVRFDVTIVVAAGGTMGYSQDKAVVTAPNGTRYTVKNDAYGMLMYSRFYPAFDAQTPGGLRYGGAGEVRSNNNTGGTGGVGVGTASQRTTNTLYWNRAYGYLGGDSWGILRFGQVDGPINLLKAGNFEGFADGGWNGTAPGFLGGYLNPWQSPIGGGYEYASTKLSYTSPSWYGFDFGVSFAPSSSTNSSGDVGTVVSGGSGRGATSVLASDLNRYRNMVELIARYRNNFGPVGLAIQGGWLGSGKINTLGQTGVGPLNRRGLSIWDAGAQINYMGFSVGGHVDTGVFNGNMNLSAPGEKAALWWLVGAQYETGPWTVGMHYMAGNRPGTLTPTIAAARGASEKFWGYSIGATYAWAPGVRTYVEFVTGGRKEPGVNLNSGATPIRSDLSGSALVVGQAFRW